MGVINKQDFGFTSKFIKALLEEWESKRFKDAGKN